MFISEHDADHMLLKKPKHPMTIRNLLTHTGGLPPKSPIEAPTIDLYPLETRVWSYAMEPLNFEPDSKYEYCNAGINTAGRIVEVVSGMPYAEFLEKRIFKPLGMNETTFWPSAEQLLRLAKSYAFDASKNGLEETTILALKYPLDDHSRQPVPAGGLFSTATDLSIFYRMIMNGGMFQGTRVLSENSVHQMTVKETGDLSTAYGFAFTLAGNRIGHNGAYNTHSSIDVEHQLITILLLQHANWSKDGKKILPSFQKAAADAFAPTAPPAN